MKNLYESIEPYDNGYLEVGDGHVIFYELCGNPKGKPVVFLHGGPGAGINEMMRRFHNPEKYMIILFDQRGCGRSKPYASLENNTTWHLVGDIEKLRIHLNIERWQVFGGSWGSTLALAYAETHPTSVTELILRGIFTLRKSEIDWFYQKGADNIFPDLFENFKKPIPQNKQANLVRAYYEVLTGDDEAKKLEAAKAWSIWEASTLSILPDEERVKHFGGDVYALAFARIECHYFINGGFLDFDDQLIKDAHKLKDIPTIIVQGRYDVCTPMRTAYDLHITMPDAEFKIIEDAGHFVGEKGIIDALITATEKFS